MELVMVKIPDPQAIDVLSVDVGGFILGQNQSGVGTFSTGNRYIGQLDELRFANATRNSRVGSD